MDNKLNNKLDNESSNKSNNTPNNKSVPISICSIVFLSLFALAGCAGKTKKINEYITHHNSLKYQEVATKNFNLATGYKINDINAPLIVYIEGDGRAWLNKYQLSDNPTPMMPIALYLANLDRSSNVLYIARPYQFTKIDKPVAEVSRYWSDERYSREVLEATNEVINKFAAQLNSHQIHVVGFSGGGTLAMLLPTINSKVISIRTVAGNIATKQFTEFHKISAMSALSLDPMEYLDEIKQIPQIHYSGMKDKVVPGSITKQAVDRINGAGAGASVSASATNFKCGKVVEVVNVAHQKGWQQVWPELVAKLPVCSDGAR